MLVLSCDLLTCMKCVPRHGCICDGWAHLLQLGQQQSLPAERHARVCRQGDRLRICKNGALENHGHDATDGGVARKVDVCRLRFREYKHGHAGLIHCPLCAYAASGSNQLRNARRHVQSQHAIWTGTIPVKERVDWRAGTPDAVRAAITRRSHVWCSELHCSVGCETSGLAHA